MRLERGTVVRLGLGKLPQLLIQEAEHVLALRSAAGTLGGGLGVAANLLLRLGTQLALGTQRLKPQQTTRRQQLAVAGQRLEGPVRLGKGGVAVAGGLHPLDLR